ncbi:hypothetical protein SAMN05428953_12134 [Mesorhizobium muleiense]|uniref:Uncharacterized protein n=1 Tax=Mesorhizobium muleiense TaxID=1004279 RepID=A0A1G9EZZ4_9HYPH|nr:hypothetical protein SAMN05428953_12134 [Mesorhizobium muleiense]
MEAQRAGSLLSPEGSAPQLLRSPEAHFSLWGPLGPRSYDEASMSSELEASN